MINVYYSAFSPQSKKHEFIHEFEPVLKSLIESLGLNPDNEIKKCPAFINAVKNVYKVKASCDYTFTWSGTDVRSEMYGQQYFNDNIIVRDIRAGFISYRNPCLYMFTDHDNLDIEVQNPSYEKLIPFSGTVIPGRYNIAKHFRKLECAIVLNKPQTVTIKDESPLYYVKFNTDEKINFIRFSMTTELLELSDTILNRKLLINRVIPLEWYYNTVEKYYKKRYLKLIKENILE